MSETPEGFTPNPLFMTGRIDTSAGEGGESLHKLNFNVFGVKDGVLSPDENAPGATIGDPEAIELQESQVGGNHLTSPEKREEGTPTQATFNPAAGTVNTSGPEGVHHDDFDPDAQPKTEGAQPGDAAVDPDGPVKPRADTKSGSPAANMRATADPGKPVRVASKKAPSKAAAAKADAKAAAAKAKVDDTKADSVKKANDETPKAAGGSADTTGDSAPTHKS